MSKILGSLVETKIEKQHPTNVYDVQVEESRGKTIVAVVEILVEGGLIGFAIYETRKCLLSLFGNKQTTTLEVEDGDKTYTLTDIVDPADSVRKGA